MDLKGRQARPPDLEYRAAFGARLRTLRAQVNVSQENLAHATDISRRYLSGIERGESNPTLDQIVKLAEGLGMQPADLLPPIRRRRKA